MFCSKCGNQILEGARFCSACGAPVSENAAPFAEVSQNAPEVAASFQDAETAEPAKPVFDEFQWNVTEYPDGNPSNRTEDVDFDWNANPKDIKDRYTRGLSIHEKAEVNALAELNVEDVIPAAVPEPEIPVEQVMPSYEEMSASDKIDKFYTFSSQNEEFQRLLNREYGKIQSGNPIGHEQNEADIAAARRFEEKEQDSSMEAFLEREGIVKPYEPKPFQSDVLQRIEAQERAKEEAALEEEARQKALEEARLAAEAEMRAAEEARRVAEENVRLEAEEEARRRELEERRVRVAEEARARAAEEAKIAAEEARRAEEEALRAAEREAIIRAEEEERQREEQKAAVLKAQADLKAQQEADKIKAQREARRAKTEEEKHIAEIGRRRREEEELKEKLSRKQEKLADQADSAATAEEIRKVLAQTARMREEEAAKIRAAVAGLRSDISAPEKPEQAVEPIQTVEPASFVEPSPAMEPEQAVKPSPFVEPSPVMEPEQAVKPSPVVEPAPVMEPEQAVKPAPFAEPTPVVEPVPVVEQVRSSAPAAEPVPAVPVVPVELENSMASDPANIKAHKETQSDLNGMAKARQEFLAEFGLNGESEPAPAPAPQAVPERRRTPVTMEELLGEKPVTGRNTMSSEGSSMTATRVVDKAAVLAGMESTMRITKEELRHKDEEKKAEAAKPAPAPQKPATAPATVEELLQQFGGESSEEIPAAPVPPLVSDEQIVEGFAPKEEPGLEPDAVSAEESKPGLDNTMVMPENMAASVNGTFEEYGEKEAEDFRRRQEAAAAMDSFYGEAQTPDTAEAGVENYDEDYKDNKAPSEKKKGGAGKVVLKILLVILIIIFAIELAGIVIKFAAPNSGAADFIDSQLNKVIQLITGSTNDYTIEGIEYKA